MSSAANERRLPREDTGIEPLCIECGFSDCQCEDSGSGATGQPEAAGGVVGDKSSGSATSSVSTGRTASAASDVRGSERSDAKRYATIVADPPWEIQMRMGAGGRRARSTEVPYSFMSLTEIMALPVDELAANAAHLYLWSTRRNFREGIACAVARAWGFEPSGELIWGLRNGGMGGILGNGHEPVLLASRGDLPWPKDELPASVIFWKQPYGKGKIHSAKPDGLQDLVERMSPGPYLEMFARRQRLGWDTWGNEALNHVEVAA